MDFLLSRAARYAARIRVELNSECVKLHKVGGLGIKLMHETVPLYNPLGRPDQFVRDLVHATLLDERAAYVESRVCYVESLTEAAVDRYLWRFSGGRLGKEEQPATEEEEIGESKEAAVAVPAVAVDALMVVAPAAEGQLGKEEQPAMATTAVAMPIRCSEEAAVALPSKAPVAVVAPAPTAPLPCSSAGGQPWWEAMAARATAAQTSLLGRLRRGVHKAYEAAAAAGDWLAGKVEGAYELGKAAVVAARRATGRVAEWWADNVCVNRHMTLAAVAVSIMCALVGWWWGQSRASSMHTTTPIFVMGRTGAAHVRRRS